MLNWLWNYDLLFHWIRSQTIIIIFFLINRSQSMMKRLSSLKYLKDIEWYDLSWNSSLILFLTSRILSEQKHITWLMTMSLYWRKQLVISSLLFNWNVLFPLLLSLFICWVFCRTEIEWYPRKSLMQKILKKKPRKGSKNAESSTKTKDCPSFFNFLIPPQSLRWMMISMKIL